MNRTRTVLICLLILIVGGAITYFIFRTEPTAKKEGAMKETAMLVEVTGVEQGSFRPTIVATGTVQPEQDVMLSPRVAGEITWRSQDFTPGGTVRKGQKLLQIDPADYQNALEMRQTELQQALSDLEIEMGRQDVAERDYALFDDTLSANNEALVLRQPQLKAAQSAVEAARVAVKQAELELQRTSIVAPFDAHVLSRNANVGSQVAPGEDLGRLVGTDVYWVVATVPLAKLRWLAFPGSGQAKGSEVRIRNQSAWGENVFRTGHLAELIGSLEGQTRLARVLVEVQDPLARSKGNAGLPPLMIGAFVEASITGEEISDVVRLNRDYLRKDNTVWLMEGDTLNIDTVDVVFLDAENAYISSDLDPEAKIVMTNLSTVAEGARVRLPRSDNATESADLEDSEPGQQESSQSTGGQQ